MSIIDLKNLAENLRRHLLTYPQLPVKGGQFSLDALAAEGASMSLQMNPGQEIRRSVNGRRTFKQPFTLYYRSQATGGDEDKSIMMGALNDIGVWLESQKKLPFLGEGVHPAKIEQAALASIVEQDNVVLAYMATFALEYNTRPQG